METNIHINDLTDTIGELKLANDVVLAGLTVAVAELSADPIKRVEIFISDAEKFFEENSKAIGKDTPYARKTVSDIYQNALRSFRKAGL